MDARIAIAGAVSGLMLLFSAASAPAVADADLDRLTQAQTALGLRILRSAVGKGAENVVLSPVSIALALDLAYAGARGNTEAELSQVLAAGLPRQRLLGAAGRELDRLSALSDTDEIDLAVANAVYLDKQCPVAELFSETVRSTFRSEVFAELDKSAINAWIEERTAGKITGLADGLSEETVFAMVNAVYLHAPWADPFNPSATRREAFHLADGTTAMVDMMRRTDTMRYMEMPEARAVSLTYAGLGLHFVLFLPEPDTGLAAFEAALSEGDRLSRLVGRLAGARRVKVALSMPRFKTSYKANLASALADAELRVAMSDNADFSAICDPARALKIDAVLHETVIEVTETGTEGAAATIVAGVEGTSVQQPVEPIVFTVDRPFFFVVSDVATDTVLFMGRIVDPR